MPSLPTFASSISDADSATAQFWPTIAHHGFGYNLIIPEKVKRSTAQSLRRTFKAIWNHELDAAVAAGRLYVIDMSRFESLQPQTVHGATRFTPATVTLLTQNARTKNLTPVAVLVSGYRGGGAPAVRAINGERWRMDLRATGGEDLDHRVRRLARPRLPLAHRHRRHADDDVQHLPDEPSHLPICSPRNRTSLIGFDDVLLLLWSRIAPPTSLANPLEFLQLANDYAMGRTYFDDDPKVTMAQLGLPQADFTVTKPWDRYPVVQGLLEVWD